MFVGIPFLSMSLTLTRRKKRRLKGLTALKSLSRALGRLAVLLVGFVSMSFVTLTFLGGKNWMTSSSDLMLSTTFPKEPGPSCTSRISVTPLP